jgi:hypothetical protein
MVNNNIIRITQVSNRCDLGGQYKFKAYINNKPVVDRNTEVFIKGRNEKQALAIFNMFYNENGVRR